MSSFKRPWHSAHETNEYEPEIAKKGGSGRAIPPEVIKREARKSKEGGTAFCHFCNKRFGMSYIRWCKVGPFEFDHVCVWCKKEKGLTGG